MYQLAFLLSGKSPAAAVEISAAEWRMRLEPGGHRFRLNIWDVGGQKTIRSYWRNYYEATEGLIWVVDSADVHRLRDCAQVCRESTAHMH